MRTTDASTAPRPSTISRWFCELNIHNEFYPAGRTVYNVVGELPGTDKADEVVMAGGHFDSWNPATGATDNAAGGVGGGGGVAADSHAEPAASPHPPRGAVERRGGRAVRFDRVCGAALRQRRESQAGMVQAGCLSEPGRRHRQAARRRACSGRPRPRRWCIRRWDNFKDWGFYNTNPTVGRQTGGTDSTSFNNAGLPGVGYSQDPFDYNTYTHHTSFDTYERIYEPDMREAAVEEALTLYALANTDQMVPRCSAATMPPPPSPRRGRAEAGCGRAGDAGGGVYAAGGGDCAGASQPLHGGAAGQGCAGFLGDGEWGWVGEVRVGFGRRRE